MEHGVWQIQIVDSKLVKILALRRLNLAAASEAVDWAMSALEAGADSPNLRILAGMPEPLNDFEVDDCLQRTARDLGYATADPDMHVHAYVRDIAADIVTGRLRPKDGCVELKRVARAFQGPDLVVWVGLAEDFYLADQVTTVNLGDLEDRIIEQAKLLLSD